MRLSWDDDVVTLDFQLHAEPAECVGDDSELSQMYVLYAYAVAHHCRHAYERAYFNHVGQYTVFGSVESFRADDGYEVAGYA